MRFGCRRPAIHSKQTERLQTLNTPNQKFSTPLVRPEIVNKLAQSLKSFGKRPLLPNPLPLKEIQQRAHMQGAPSQLLLPQIVQNLIFGR